MVLLRYGGVVEERHASNVVAVVDLFLEGTVALWHMSGVGESRGGCGGDAFFFSSFLLFIASI